MAVLRFTEDAAATLLHEWKADVALSLAPPALLRGQLHHPTIEVSDLWLDSDHQTADDRARRLRDYMEVLRLVSCCRGLDPRQNPAFWREHFTSCGLSPTHRITRQLFCNFHVVCAANTGADSIAAAMWELTRPSRATEGPFASVLQSIEGRLEAFLKRTPPPLQVTLAIRTNRVRWSTIKQALIDLEQRIAKTASASSDHKIRLVIGESTQLKYVGPDDDQAILLEIIQMRHVIVEELHVRLDTPNAEEINALMCALVRVDSVKDLSCEFECEPHVVAALFSALPSMKTLSALQLDCHHYHSGAEDEACRLGPWLAYALTQRNRVRGLPLAIHFHPTSTITRDITAACRQKNCLAGVVPTATSKEDSTVFYENGVTAELLHRPVLSSFQAGVNSTDVVAPPSQRVNIIAQHDSTVTVVVPGAGLVTIDPSDIKASEGPSQGAEAFERGSLRVDALTCDCSEPTEITETLELFGADLRCLALRACSPVQTETLEQILSLCPNLTSLVAIYGKIETLQPLLAAYANSQTRITTLIYEPSRRSAQSDEALGNVVRQCVDALATPGHPISDILQELCVVRVTLPSDLMRRLARALRGNKRLDFLRVWPEYDRQDDELEEETLLEDLVDQRLRQHECSRRALYTFLSVARRKRVLRELPVPCLETVARFVATPMLRHFSML